MMYSSFRPFRSPSHKPCRMMPLILKEVKKQLGDKVRILKIDVDPKPAIAGKYQIQSVPTK